MKPHINFNYPIFILVVLLIPTFCNAHTTTFGVFCVKITFVCEPNCSIGFLFS